MLYISQCCGIITIVVTFVLLLLCCTYSNAVARSPLLLLAKFSYLRALTAETNLECQDSWKVNTLVGFITLLNQLLSYLAAGLNLSFSLRSGPSWFPRVSRFLNIFKVLKEWILKTVLRVESTLGRGWWGSFEDIKTFTAFLAPSPSPLSIFPIQTFCIFPQIPQMIYHWIYWIYWIYSI